MEDFQLRVVDEHRELDGKLSKLRSFFAAPGFQALPELEQWRLKQQEIHMRAYRDILAARIRAFGGEAA